MASNQADIIDLLLEKMNLSLDFVDYTSLRQEIQRVLDCDFDLAMRLVWRFLASGLCECWSKKRQAYNLDRFRKMREPDPRTLWHEAIAERWGSTRSTSYRSLKAQVNQLQKKLGKLGVTVPNSNHLRYEKLEEHELEAMVL